MVIICSGAIMMDLFITIRLQLIVAFCVKELFSY